MQARSLARGLAPIDIDSAGLLRALQDLADRTQQTYDVRCVFECPQPVAITNSFRATHLYRIAREAVHNALKHAKANRIVIEVRDGDSVQLAVRDDGIGINSDRFTEGEGLRIMRYRAGLIGGSISIKDATSGGTIVTCTSER